MKHLTHTQVPRDQLDITKLIHQSMAEVRNVPERASDRPFELPLVNPTRSQILRGLFFFDKLEFGLLFLSFYLTKLIFQPLIGSPMISEPLITFWGIVGIMLYTYRHSSSSIFQYLAHRNLLDKNIKEGKFSVEFRLIGFLTSLILTIFGKQISVAILWYLSHKA